MRFESRGGLVTVAAAVTGPAGLVIVDLAVDTGSARTVIREAMLEQAGVTPEARRRTVQVNTATGSQTSYVVSVPSLAALHHEVIDFEVVGHQYPDTITVDGVLGLDFFRNKRLILDFARGEVTLD